MKVEIFTVATRPAPGLQRLQASLSKFGNPVTVLGEGEAEFWGYAWRWKTFIRAARLSKAEVVVHCDAYDSICLGPMDTMTASFVALAHPIVFSYQPQEQPEYWLALNPGLMMANREALLKVFTESWLEEFFPDHFNDQFQIQSMYAWNPAAFSVDKDGVLFHTISPRAARLTVKNNRLTNPETGKAPSFVHAPNGQDLSEIERLIAGLNP